MIRALVLLAALAAVAPGAPLSRQVAGICAPGLGCPAGYVCVLNLCVSFVDPTPVNALPVPSPGPPLLPPPFPVPVSPEPSPMPVWSPEPSLPPTQVLPPPVTSPAITPSPLPSMSNHVNAGAGVECAPCVNPADCGSNNCHNNKCVYGDFRFRGSIFNCFGAMV